MQPFQLQNNYTAMCGPEFVRSLSLMRCFQLFAWEDGKSSVCSKACLCFFYHMLGWEFLQPVLTRPPPAGGRGNFSTFSPSCPQLARVTWRQPAARACVHAQECIIDVAGPLLGDGFTSLSHPDGAGRTPGHWGYRRCDC